MNKPDDIPQDVWEIATGIEVMDESVCDWDYNLAIDISKAIMAAKAEEREKAAAYIDARATDIRKNGNVTSMTLATIFEAEAKAIRHLIGL